MASTGLPVERGWALPRPHPAVVCKPVSEGAVLLHTESEVYFGLNPVGLRVWELLPPTCASFDEVCDRVASGYPEVDAALIRQDVAELLQSLLEEGLVLPAER